MTALSIAAAAAAHLGEGWAAADGSYPDGTSAFLTGSDGEQVHVTLNNYHAAARGRVFLRGTLPNDLREHAAYRADLGDISVAISRGPEVIAKEVTRRLLPQYRQALATARSNKQKADWREARRQQWITEIVAAIGPDGSRDERLNGRGHDVSLGRWGDPVRADIEVSETSHRRDESTEQGEVKMEIYVPPSTAPRLAALLAELRAETTITTEEQS